MKNPVVHFEIQSQDPGALRGFYGELFDWNVRQHEEIDYDVVTTRGEDDPAGINGGIAGTRGGRTVSPFTYKSTTSRSGCRKRSSSAPP